MPCRTQGYGSLEAATPLDLHTDLLGVVGNLACIVSTLSGILLAALLIKHQLARPLPILLCGITVPRMKREWYVLLTCSYWHEKHGEKLKGLGVRLVVLTKF